MIAYDKTSLDNLRIHEMLDLACRENTISKTDCGEAKKGYPVNLYTPNLFIRIGLFVLTLVVTGFSFGLFSLIFLSVSGGGAFGVLSVLFGLISYGALEFIVKSRHHYKSGVDDALLWMSVSLLVSGLNELLQISFLGNAIIIFFVATYVSIRFVDRFMSIVACCALLTIVVLGYVKLGNQAKATTPFLLMALSAAIYFVARKFSTRNELRFYQACFKAVEITVLVCFYLAGNYFVVTQASNIMFNLNLQAGEGLPQNKMFWLTTIAIPFIYVLRGIQKKDVVLLRLGLLLIAAVVFTVRYYNAVLSIEAAMIIGGILLLAISYAVIKYLHKPRHGFTYQPSADKNYLDNLQVESLVISQTFSPSAQPAAGDTTFGGGSGGGGGATGEF